MARILPWERITLPQPNNNPILKFILNAHIFPKQKSFLFVTIYHYGCWTELPVPILFQAAWTDCPAESGKCGVQTRWRHCNNPAPKNGGLSCLGSEYEFKKCGKWPCDGTFVMYAHDNMRQNFKCSPRSIMILHSPSNSVTVLRLCNTWRVAVSSWRHFLPCSTDRGCDSKLLK